MVWSFDAERLGWCTPVHDYIFDATTVRLVVIVGVITSLLFYERFQLTAGGAIVPGYIALFISTPLFIVMTMLTAYLTYYVVNHWMARWMILYGRRKYEIEILVALGLLSLWFTVAHFVIALHPLLTALYSIGFIIPAVIAHDMFRQGPSKTTIALLVNTVVVGIFVYVFSSLSSIAPWYRPDELTRLGGNDPGYPVELLLPAVITSVGAGMLVFGKLGLRTGGFVVGAYLALVLLQPLDLVFVLAITVATYGFVTRFLMRKVLVFGRRKLGMMILMGAIFAWAGEIGIRLLTDGQYVPWPGFNVITLMVPALLANDAQRQGLHRTFLGAAITSVAVFAIMNLFDAARLYVQGAVG